MQQLLVKMLWSNIETIRSNGFSHLTRQRFTLPEESLAPFTGFIQMTQDPYPNLLSATFTTVHMHNEDKCTQYNNFCKLKKKKITGDMFYNKVYFNPIKISIFN